VNGTELPLSFFVARHSVGGCSDGARFTGKQEVTDYFRIADIRPECELGLGCMYSSPSARFSALHTFQAFGNSLYRSEGDIRETGKLTQIEAVHGELLNCGKIRCFLGFDTMPGCAMSSSFSFI